MVFLCFPDIMLGPFIWREQLEKYCLYTNAYLLICIELQNPDLVFNLIVSFQCSWRSQMESWYYNTLQFPSPSRLLNLIVLWRNKVEPAPPSLGIASQTSHIDSTNQTRSSIYVNTQKKNKRKHSICLFFWPEFTVN